jgi:hypothetical protein|eukprot:scaffold1772_cov185-Alexandrium_tamarense.AAC.6
MNRLLRGGSGGSGGSGGGGGGYSGGSSSYGGYSGGSSSYGGSRPFYYGSSTNNANCYEGEDCREKSPIWIGIVMAIGIVGFICCICCIIRHKKMVAEGYIAGGGDNADINKDEEFDTAVSEARRNIAYKSAPNATEVRFQTYTATFDTEYTDRGKTLTAELDIRLVNDGFSGYTIEGEAIDADGTTKFKDGFVTYDGVCWWLEETMSGQDTGLKVLSQGTFDFTKNTFTGTWRSSSKCQGQYTSFTCRNVVTTFPDTNDNGGEDDIPVVVASAEESIPVVYASAYAPNGGECCHA